MKSTLIVGIGASLLTAGIAKAQQRQDITPRTPNILFIYADDLGYGDLECYDGTQVKTPNINRLAKNGIRFTNAHATASTSTPSRYSMLTGEYAWRRPGTDIAVGNAGMIIRPVILTRHRIRRISSAVFVKCRILAQTFQRLR